MPLSRPKILWDFYMFILIIWTAIALPYITCFYPEHTNPYLLAFEITMDFSFFIDILLSFFTAIKNYDTGRYEFNKYKIALIYVKSWFVIDVISTIPWSLIEIVRKGEDDDHDAEHTKIVRILKMNRFYRFFKLFRLIKILRVVKFMSSSLSSDVLSKSEIMRRNNNCKNFVSMLSAYLLFTHWVACIWFLQSKLYDFYPNSWVNENKMAYKDAF